MIDLADAREQMIERQVARRGLRDSRLLVALRQTPRELFVPEGLREFAYDDTPLPIESGQTISQPYIVALMIDAARPQPGDRALEVGTGSGYAAAVLARLTAEVHTIERHADLAGTARSRLARLGLANVETHVGDGTLGWVAAAPYDVILVAAGGPAVPQALKDQLDLGGRLVMPVGEQAGEQRLVRITRTGANHFEEDDLGGVVFVPLIGEPLIAQAAEPLPDLDDPAFGALFDRFAEARVVLLGEASHGTSEFYRARAAITRRLVEKHGFSIVAVEADWPDAASIDRRSAAAGPGRQRRAAVPALPDLDVAQPRGRGLHRLAAAWNAGRPMEERVGFYGLDLYNLSASLRAVLDYLDEVDPEAAAVARERYGCLTPWARATGLWPHGPHHRLRPLRGRGGQDPDRPAPAPARLRGQDGDDFLDAAANARLVKNAEAYYRAMYYGAAESWNLRDTHMFETLTAVLDARGPQAKAVVWAHNSHIGDASKTEMGLSRGELNIGQLCRERFGSQAALIGFGTHTGTVACASDWDGPLEIKRVRPSLPDSYERLAHDSGVQRGFLLDLREGRHRDLCATGCSTRGWSASSA
jgi:protein-L-isoaspartate(D-aspartate) O-methyltransferase